VLRQVYWSLCRKGTGYFRCYQIWFSPRERCLQSRDPSRWLRWHYSHRKHTLCLSHWIHSQRQDPLLVNKPPQQHHSPHLWCSWCPPTYLETQLGLIRSIDSSAGNLLLLCWRLPNVDVASLGLRFGDDALALENIESERLQSIVGPHGLDSSLNSLHFRHLSPLFSSRVNAQLKFIWLYSRCSFMCDVCISCLSKPSSEASCHWIRYSFQNATKIDDLALEHLEYSWNYPDTVKGLSKRVHRTTFRCI